MLPESQKKLAELIDQNFKEKLTPEQNGKWEFNLTYRFSRDKMFDLFKELKVGAGFEFDMLIDVTAVDFLDLREHCHEQRFEVVYQLLSLKYKHRLMLKVSVDESNPEVDSVRPLWAAANFLEREVWDMYGISFKGHGDLRRILMYDEFVGHPLRKDYPLKGKQPRVDLRIPELRNDSVDLFREELVSLPTPKRKNFTVVGA